MLDLSENPFSECSSEGRQELLYLAGIRSLVDLRVTGVCERRDILRLLPALKSLNGVDVGMHERRDAITMKAPLLSKMPPIEKIPREDPRVVPVAYSDPKTEAELVYKEAEVIRLSKNIADLREELKAEKEERKILDHRTKEKDKEWCQILRKVDKELEDRNSRIASMEDSIQKAKNENQLVRYEHESELKKIQLTAEAMHTKYSYDMKHSQEEKDGLRIELERTRLDLQARDAEAKLLGSHMDQLAKELAKREQVNADSLKNLEGKSAQESHWLVEQVDALKRSEATKSERIALLECREMELTESLRSASERQVVLETQIRTWVMSFSFLPLLARLQKFHHRNGGKKRRDLSSIR